MRLSVHNKWLLASLLTALMLLILRAIISTLQYFQVNVANSLFSILQMVLIIVSLGFMIIGWFIILQKYRKEKKADENLSNSGFKSFKSSVVLSVLTVLFILLPFPKFTGNNVTQKRSETLQNISQVNNKQECEVPSKSIAGELNGSMKSDSTDTLNASHLLNHRKK